MQYNEGNMKTEYKNESETCIVVILKSELVAVRCECWDAQAGEREGREKEGTRKEKGNIERETEDYQESTMQHFYYIIIQSVVQAFYIIYIALLYIKSGPP